MSLFKIVLIILCFSHLFAYGALKDLKKSDDIEQNNNEIELTTFSSQTSDIEKRESPTGVRLNQGIYKEFEETLGDNTFLQITQFNNLNSILENKPKLFMKYVLASTSSILKIKLSDEDKIEKLNEFFMMICSHDIINNLSKNKSQADKLTGVVLESILSKPFGPEDYLHRFLKKHIYTQIIPPLWFQFSVGVFDALTLNHYENRLWMRGWYQFSEEFTSQSQERIFKEFEEQLIDQLKLHVEKEVEYDDIDTLFKICSLIKKDYLENVLLLIHEDLQKNLVSFNIPLLLKNNKSLKLPIHYTLMIHHLSGLAVRSQPEFKKSQKKISQMVRQRVNVKRINSILEKIGMVDSDDILVQYQIDLIQRNFID